MNSFVNLAETEKKQSFAKRRALRAIKKRALQQLNDDVAYCLSADMTMEQFVDACTTVMSIKSESDKQAFVTKLWSAFSGMGGSI